MTGVVPDKESVRRLLTGMKEFPPKVRTATRRELRTVGDDVIAEQRAILDGPLPTGTQKLRSRPMLVLSKKTNTLRLAKSNVYGDREVKRPGRSTGLREGIKAGLKTRVVTGAKYQGINVQTTGPRVGNPKFNQAKFWQKKRFRHPLFGNRERFVYQQGQPYFHAPILRGRDDMIRRAEEILSSAVDQA